MEADGKLFKARKDGALYKNKNIAVIVPCFNEQENIRAVLETMPEFVDRLIVVDDGSTDRTTEAVESLMALDPRIVLLHHVRNLGVGAALASGYRWARDQDADVAAVMAGDGQMDPADLPAILDPVTEGRADYSKGNRFKGNQPPGQMPALRAAGIRILTVITRALSGYRDIHDVQNGYTAMGKTALHTLDWDGLYSGYGELNDLLFKLGRHGFRVAEAPNRALYPPGGKSKLKIRRVLLPMSRLLLRLAMMRITHPSPLPVKPLQEMPAENGDSGLNHLER